MIIQTGQRTDIPAVLQNEELWQELLAYNQWWYVTLTEEVEKLLDRTNR